LFLCILSLNRTEFPTVIVPFQHLYLHQLSSPYSYQLLSQPRDLNRTPDQFVMSRIWSLLRLVPRRVPFPHTTRPWSWSLSSIRGFPSPKLPGKPGIPTAEALRYSCGSSCLQKALQENVKKLAGSEPRCEGWDKMDTK
jgi:hypothetical protein